MSDNIWDNAPDWAVWVATDSDGTVWFYEEKPMAEFAAWIAMTGKEKFASTKGNPTAWRSSLRQRPGAKEATQ